MAGRLQENEALVKAFTAEELASLDKFVRSPVPGCARIGMLGVQNWFAEL